MKNILLLILTILLFPFLFIFFLVVGVIGGTWNKRG